MPAQVHGLPRILGSNTTANADDALAVLSPRKLISAGTLCYNACKSRTLPIDCIVDPIRARVYVTEESSFVSDILAAVEQDHFLLVQADTLGLFSHWSILDQLDFIDVPLTTEFFHTHNNRTMARVLDAYVNDLTHTFAIVRQSDATVRLFQPADGQNSSDVSDILDGITASGFTACYEFTHLPTERLIFE